MSVTASNGLAMLKFTDNSLLLTVPTFAPKLARFLQAIVKEGVGRNYPSFVGSVFRKFTVNFAVFGAEVKKQANMTSIHLYQNLRLLSDERSAPWERKFYIPEALRACGLRGSRVAQMWF